MVDYLGKKIVILGIGLTGLSCINFFLKRGVIPSIMDTRVSPPNLNKLPKQIKCHLGSLNDKWLLNADLIVISPGISLMHPSISAAINAGIEIIGDVELFCREVQAPVIAITGSNGKSTVTSLLGKMAKAAGINVGIGGNIGLPVLMLLDAIKELYIIELSSFQLEITYSLQAIAATILNITEDHMDRYSFNLQKYCTAKLRIYKNAKSCIFNTDYILTTPIYSKNKRYISFGTNIGDYHLYRKKKEIWLHANGKNILNVKDMLLFGQHNYINGLAALALADTFGLPQTSSLEALATFTGLDHRFQLVLERNGIRWINDSKATNIGSVKEALNCLCINGTLHLLLGGDGKSANFSLLKPYISKVSNKVLLYCFGSDRDKIAMMELTKIVKQTETLEQAMYLIARYVNSGDVVLLSPACSSLDQFQNFEERGALFTYLAKKIG